MNSCQFESVQNRIWLCRRNTNDLSSSSAPDHHEAIVGGLQGDRAAVQRAMSEHIGHIRQKLMRFLSSRERATLAG
jgi:DNA-binding GntR family transcriptional regulator